MVLKNYEDLIKRVKNNTKKTVALVAANDIHSLKAVIQASDIVNSILVGDANKINETLLSIGQNPADFEVVQQREGEHPCVTAAKLIHAGRADFLMKGKITTGEMLKGILLEESGLRKSSLMTHLSIQEVPGYHKLIFLTDSGMCLYPDLKQKKQILINGLEFMHSLGYECPNVAALCAVEKVNPKMPETIDANELKKMAITGEFPKCYVEGPISYDLAMVPEAARIKGFDCPCSGNFDMLLVPNIVVGNVLGKCLVYTAKGKMAGLIIGAKVPVVLTSRGATTEEKYNSIAIAAGV